MEKKRISIEVDEDLKHNAKTKALQEKKTLTKVIVDFLIKWTKK